MKVPNDVLFEIIKYRTILPRRKVLTDIENSTVYKKYMSKQISRYLESKIKNRPTYEELIKKNILKAKNSTLNFEKLHQELMKINFSSHAVDRISPLVAGRAKSLEFHLKKKKIINELNLEKYENMYRSF